MLETKEKNQPYQLRTTYFGEYLTTALIVGLLITYLAGYWSLPTSGHVSAVQVWLWSLVQWSIGIAAVLSGVSVAWYAPQLWGKRRVVLSQQKTQLAQEDTERTQLTQRVKRGDLEIESLRADIAAKLAAIQNEQLRTQAEIRQIAVHVESLTANKSTLLIDSSQANWQDSARLLTHPDKLDSTASDATEPGNILAHADWFDEVVNAVHCAFYGATNSGKTTLARAICNARSQTDQFVTLDPHSRIGDWSNAIVFGRGRNYHQINEALLRLVEELDKRYKSYALGSDDYEPVTIICDEVPAIAEHCKAWSNFYGQIAMEGRKVNMRLLILVQGELVKLLGIEGKSHIRENFTNVRLGRFAVKKYRAAAEMNRPAILDVMGEYECIDTALIPTLAQEAATFNLFDGLSEIAPPAKLTDKQSELIRMYQAGDTLKAMTAFYYDKPLKSVNGRYTKRVQSDLSRLGYTYVNGNGKGH